MTKATGKVTQNTAVVTEWQMTDGNLGMECLTNLCNLTFTQRKKIPDDWQYSTLHCCQYIK